MLRVAAGGVQRSRSFAVLHYPVLTSYPKPIISYQTSSGVRVQNQVVRTAHIHSLGRVRVSLLRCLAEGPRISTMAYPLQPQGHCTSSMSLQTLGEEQYYDPGLIRYHTIL